MRILFICKKNETYGFVTLHRRSSGLFNSTRFIVEGLAARGVHAHIVEVQDNNYIDREVSAFKPDLVVLEALWVVPSKFDVLKRLHPRVKWYLHLHSHMPFLALEGIAMRWIEQYQEEGVGVITNSTESWEALRAAFPEVKYLPNVYISHPRSPKFMWGKPAIDIGCFGAMRPLKNHLLQALSAIQFANEKKRRLNFHINGSRVETGGAPVLKNLVQLFEDQEKIHGHKLIQHDWNEPEDFLNILQGMDIGMQVSLTETFNVVTADYVTAGIPIVVSKEVKWASSWNKALDNSLPDIVDKMHRVWRNKLLVRWNQRLLLWHSKTAQELWYRFVKKETRC